MNKLMYEYMYKTFKKEIDPSFDDTVPSTGIEILFKYYIL